MRISFAQFKFVSCVLALVATTFLTSAGSHAQQTAAVGITVKGHHFQPAEIRATANKRLTLRVKNLDSTPMEFESVSLRVEKVVAPGTEGIINIRPLAPGRYEFFDDFHQETRGILVVQ
jgi:Cupredoxin-like domain